VSDTDRSHDNDQNKYLLASMQFQCQLCLFTAIHKSSPVSIRCTLQNLARNSRSSG